MAGNAHFENFSGITVGQPVTTENTSFQRYEGAVQTAGTGRDGYFSLGCQILNDQAGGGAGWLDVGWFDSTMVDGPRKIVVSMYFRLDGDPFIAGQLHFAWLTSTPGAVAPLASLAIEYGDGFEGVGITGASGDTYPEVGVWWRIVWEFTENGADADIEVSMWRGQTINSGLPEDRIGVLTGSLTNGSALLENCWLLFGRHSNYAVGGSWLDMTLDSVAVSNAPWEPTMPSPQPGFFVGKGDGVPMPRAELLGSWNGSGYDELEFFGRWNGSSPINPNWDFETGTEGWASSVAGTTIATTTVWAQTGVQSMDITGVGAMTATVITPAIPIEIPQSENQWTFEGWMNPVSGVTRIYFTMFLYDEDGVYLDQRGVQSIINPPVGDPQWLRVSQAVEVGVNDTAAQAILMIRVEGTNPHAYVDDMIFRYGPPGGAEDQADMVDTLWMEPWAPNGVVGAPWTVVSGTPDKVGGTITDTANWMVRRAGPSGDSYFAFYRSTINGDAGMDFLWNTATSTGMRMLIDADFFVGSVRYTLLHDGAVQNRAIASWTVPDADPQPTYFAMRRVGNVVEVYSDGYLVGSGALTSGELAELGSDVRLHGFANDILGIARTENL